MEPHELTGVTGGTWAVLWRMGSRGKRGSGEGSWQAIAGVRGEKGWQGLLATARLDIVWGGSPGFACGSDGMLGMEERGVKDAQVLAQTPGRMELPLPETKQGTREGNRGLDF